MTKAVTTDDRWTPRRCGIEYCSQGCGRGCTWEEYQTACEDARTLCAKLGEGWQTRVWENLGWHYEAISPDGRLKVSRSISDDESYNALLGRPDENGGSWFGTGPTPQAAGSAAIQQLLDQLGIATEAHDSIAATANQLRLSLTP